MGGLERGPWPCMPELQESQAFKKSQERLDLYSQVLEGM